jgi:hypothetical protein
MRGGRLGCAGGLKGKTKGAHHAKPPEILLYHDKPPCFMCSSIPLKPQK